MNQQFWSSLSAALLITTLGTATSSYASQTEGTDPGSETNLSSEETQPGQRQVVSTMSPVNHAPTSNAPESNNTPESEDVVKVGEHQSQTETVANEDIIARIQPHELNGRQAATVYVRNIPVLTFVGSNSTTSQETKLGESGDSDSVSSTQVIISANQDIAQAELSARPGDRQISGTTANTDYASDPIWRATAIAARLNQLYRDNGSGEAVTVKWDRQRERYTIQINDENLVEMDASIQLPDTTNNPATDALQATNRIRRQISNAPPLRDIAGRPQPRAPQPVARAAGSVRASIRGLASWYGPGFNGRRSASGEVFNQNALTAAHRSLPFGTQVRVTNLRTGLSVVVRINDRGPYSGRRVIDLSAAAARAVGLIQAGVAPVSIDVLDSRTASREN